jgi:uncharacterized protein (UPF0333 family)
MKKNKKNAQVTLEFAFAMVMVVILFWVAAVVFFYVNNRLVVRQQYYESHSYFGRQSAANQYRNDEIQVDEPSLPVLDFFRNFW